MRMSTGFQPGMAGFCMETVNPFYKRERSIQCFDTVDWATRKVAGL